MLLLISATFWGGGFSFCKNSVVIKLSGFGAKGNGISDDGPAFRKALQYAVSLAKPTILKCEPKTYRIGYRADDFFALTLENAKDITIDGQGALLVFDSRNLAIQFLNCENCKLSNFKIDYDPPPCTQGIIKEINIEDGYFIVEISKGYPFPLTDESIQPAYRHGCFLSSLNPPVYTHNWCYVQEVKRVGEDLFKISVAPVTREALQKVLPGEIFVFRNPLQAPPPTDFTQEPRAKVGNTPFNKGVFLNPPIASIQIRFSKNCTLENIEQYVSPGISIFIDGSENIFIRKYRIRYKPGTDRACASLSDGIHCKGNIIGPFIEECYFQGLWDDAINLCSTPADVIEECISNRKFKTRTLDIWWIDSYLRPGQRVLFWDRKSGISLGEYKIIEVEFLENQKRIVTVDKDVKGVIEEKSEPNFGTLVFILPGKSWVRNCVFQNSLKTAVLPAPGTVIENNLVENCAYGVNACLFDGLNLPFAWTQAFPRGIVVRNNVFRNVWIGAVVIYGGTANPSAPPLWGNIVVEGNRIYQNNGSGITITNVRKVIIKDNKIDMHPETPLNWRAIELYHCASIFIKNTKIKESRPAVESAIYAPSTHKNEIKLQNVEISTPSDVKPIYHLE